MTLQALTGWPRRHPLVVDSIVAGLLFLLLGAPAVTGLRHGVTSAGPVEVAVASAMTLVLALRRRHPVLTFTVVSLACLLQALSWPDALPSDLAFPVATYAIAAYARDAWPRRAALGVAVLGGVVAAVRWGADLGAATVISATFTGGVAVVSWIAGDLIRRRRALVARLADQNAALLRERDQREQLAAQRERSRIARDMHDVVAHGLSVIVVQADGAAYAARHAPAWERGQAAETLETLAATARSALTETRHLVGMLRRDEAAGAEDYTPVAGVEDLTLLVERLREAGLEVRLDLDGEAPAPTDTSLAAYRIAQESLTNVLKHGGPGTRATVRLRRTNAGLELEVTDDGRGAAADPAAEPGSGLVGMRERAVAVGGTLETGPRPEGGYRVRALLPTAGTPS
ncbi:sensor histidine kinase [Phycicoccus endophyticus]|uniref:histidine kinase n=1 Tax=Phycicoccus endophyticus TaxID=1690220 RepID=A0A7G9R166_9MICO|nr:sensor histidine kinase [Phycicoccus endophyticus]NHI20527.1 sensor histidine kinase [Phycicoccus endophyticus]QNN49341.1 sensor histidine kinase [Phycicoccus endophyticus]